MYPSFLANFSHIQQETETTCDANQEVKPKINRLNVDFKSINSAQIL